MMPGVPERRSHDYFRASRALSMNSGSVVGRYLDPPEKVLVPREGRTIALMRAGNPRAGEGVRVRGRAGTLFAALEVATGKVIGSLHRRHGAAEFRKFLAKLDKEVPAGLRPAPDYVLLYLLIPYDRGVP